jgi:hypothetical protein
MFGASVLGLGAARALAEPLGFTDPATALEPAQRLSIEGELAFPVAGDRCLRAPMLW